MKFDGCDVLNGRITLPRSMPCINADFSIVAWSAERGIYDVGKGLDLESARAIARLHAGHDDYMHFPEGVDVLILVGVRSLMMSAAPKKTRHEDHKAGG